MKKTQAAAPNSEKATCQVLLRFAAFSAHEEQILAYCTQVIASSAPRSRAYALAVWLIHLRRLYRPETFVAFMLTLGLEKENAHRKKRYGALLAALLEKHGPLLWPANDDHCESGSAECPPTMRLPRNEREARPFTTDKYTLAQQVEAWETAVAASGIATVTTAAAVAAMQRVAPQIQKAAGAEKPQVTAKRRMALEEEVAVLKARAESLTGSVETLTANSRVLAAKNKALSSRIAMHVAEAKSRDAKLSTTEGALLEARSSISALGAVNSALRAELAMLNADAMARRIELANLTIQASAHRAEIDELRAPANRRARLRERLYYGLLCGSHVGGSSAALFFALQQGRELFALASLAVTGALVRRSRAVYPTHFKLPLLRVP